MLGLHFQVVQYSCEINSATNQPLLLTKQLADSVSAKVENPQYRGKRFGWPVIWLFKNHSSDSAQDKLFCLHHFPPMGSLNSQYILWRVPSTLRLSNSEGITWVQGPRRALCQMCCSPTAFVEIIKVRCDNLRHKGLKPNKECRPLARGKKNMFLFFIIRSVHVRQPNGSEMATSSLNCQSDLVSMGCGLTLLTEQLSVCGWKHQRTWERLGVNFAQVTC